MNAVASMYDLTNRTGPFGVALMDTARGNPLLFPAAYQASLPVGLTSPAIALRAQPPSAPFLLPTASAKKTGFSIEDILHPREQGAGDSGNGRQGREEDAPKDATDEEAAKRMFSSRLLQTSAARAFFRLNGKHNHAFMSKTTFSWFAGVLTEPGILLTNTKPLFGPLIACNVQLKHTAHQRMSAVL